ncbi:MAG: hypothetical protein H0U49_12610 [Parachlamydiaceae bacterium]|nr:hypothetical protein [Parachlamydiaceae bacterium]
MEPTNNLKRPLHDQVILYTDDIDPNKRCCIRTPLIVDVPLGGIPIISNTALIFDDDLIDSWYEAAKNKILTNERMKLYSRTHLEATRILENISSFEKNEISFVNVKELFLRICRKFSSYTEQDSQLVGEWLYANSCGTRDRQNISAYHSFNLLSQAINKGLEIPDLKSFLIQELGKEWYGTVSWDLNPHSYNTLIIMVAQDVFKKSIKLSLELIPNDEIAIAIVSQLDCKSFKSLGRVSKFYTLIFKDLLVVNLNLERFTLPHLEVNSLGKFFTYLDNKCFNITNINLKYTDFQIDEKLFELIATFCTKLQKLSLDDCTLRSNSYLKPLNELPLTALSLNGCKIFDNSLNKKRYLPCLKFLQDFTAIKSLDISYLPLVSDYSFLQKLTALESLNLSNNYANLNFLEQCTRIRNLNLYCCNILDSAPFDQYFKGGKYTATNGSIYEGYFKNGQLKGAGSIYYTDGDKLTGDFNGENCTYGIKYNSIGNKIYEGSFRYEKYNGKGIQFYTTGAKEYEGSFIDDGAHGQGISYYKDGSIRYEGAWANNGTQGTGRMYYIGGAILIGEFFMENESIFCTGTLLLPSKQNIHGKFLCNMIDSSEMPTQVLENPTEAPQHMDLQG